MDKINKIYDLSSSILSKINNLSKIDNIILNYDSFHIPKQKVIQKSELSLSTIINEIKYIKTILWEDINYEIIIKIGNLLDPIIKSKYNNIVDCDYYAVIIKPGNRETNNPPGIYISSIHLFVDVFHVTEKYKYKYKILREKYLKLHEKYLKSLKKI
jgi:hypothetical protein